MEKYVKDGKIAILYSPGFGAGWSTWLKREIAYDKRVVEFWLEHKDDKEYISKLSSYGDNETKKAALEYFTSIGYSDVYFGGFGSLKIKWIPIGTKFIVREYDGSEYIETEEKVEWDIA